MVVAVVAGLAAVLGVAVVIGLRNRAPPPGGQVSVMPFAVRGCEHLGYLRWGIIDLLSDALENTGAVSTADQFDVQTALNGDSVIDLTRARVAARRLRARIFVVGNVVGDGSGCVIRITIHEPARARQQATSVTVTGETTVQQAVNRLADRVAAFALADSTGSVTAAPAVP